MNDLRRISPIDIEKLTPIAPDTGPPIFEWYDPCDLYVDPNYQRDIGTRGQKQIVKIIETFSWAKFKPPICAFSEIDGKNVLMVLDGQHTAIAAASNPNVAQIPVMIVEAGDVVRQAQSFIGHNTDRMNVTNLQLHRAALVAGKEDALTVHQVCERVGMRVLREAPTSGIYETGDTLAIKALSSLVERHHPIGARKILEVLVNADLGPITGQQIKAAEFLLHDPDHAVKINPEDLSDTIRGSYPVDYDEAKLLSVSHKVPVWRALAMVWFKKTKKRRLARKGLS